MLLTLQPCMQPNTKFKTKTEKVIFENITQDESASNTTNSLRSGGPTQIEMETWKEMICSKSYGTHSQKLADEIAILAKCLVTDTIPHDYIHINSPRMTTGSIKVKRQQH